MKFFNIKSFIAAIGLLLTYQMFVSCSDELDMSDDSYYTSTKEYASSYLTGRSQFSMYVEILNRAKGERGDLRLVDMLGTYGSYTVFAPTNDAILSYLKARDMSSVSQLSDADCDTIALNSIIEIAYFTTDYSSATYPKSNMLEHPMSIDTLDGAFIINKSSILTQWDDSVCNGVVHTVGAVVQASDDLLPLLMEQDSTITLYNKALAITGIAMKMQDYNDESYGWSKDQDRIDSCTWTNDKLCIHTAAEYDNVAYPEKRYYNFTAFVVQDSILQTEYGIDHLFKSEDNKYDGKSLEEYAHEIYDDVYPEDKDNNDYKDSKNALNRFIAYHVLNRYGTYYTLTCMDNGRLKNNFNRRKFDITDYYETMMPYSLMKFSFPSGTQEGLYINRRGAQSRADGYGVMIRGSKVANESNGPKSPYAKNGVYHYIDKIISYGRETQEVVLNERMRFDCSTLSPDFMTKLTDGETARGHSSTFAGSDNYKYGQGGQGQIAANNTDHCIGFKAGYCRNFEYDNNTHLHVRNRVLGYWSYEGDEVTVKGQFNIKVKLPPVPAGTYEVRMMTCVGFSSRGIMQAYIDGVSTGIPFDMRPGGEALFGYKNDATLGGDDEITAFDKAIHNIGWMKGPDCYASGGKDSFSGTTFRNQNNTIRRIIGTFTTDGKSDHILQLQQKMESGGEMNFDFIELCPSSVYGNEYFAEDKW